MTTASASAPVRPRRAGAPLAWSHRTVETGALTLWFAVTATPFPGDAALLYGLTLYFMAGLWIRRRGVAVLARLGWPILLAPLIAVLSVVWSEAPLLSLRAGLQVLLTALISLYVATRYEARAVVLALAIAGAITALISLPHALMQIASGEEARGVFDHKNFLAKRMSLAALAAAALAFDVGRRAGVRLFGLALLAVTVFLVVMSRSATAAVALGAGLALLIGFVLVWRPARGARALVAAGAAALMLGGAFAAIAAGSGRDVETQALRALGKDDTLTGRTLLWTAAGKQIEERPLLGRGHSAFWRDDVREAQALLDLSYKPRGTVFTFHNSWLETAVALGLMGAGALAIGVIWSVLASSAWALQDGAPTGVFFLAATVVAVVRSLVESDLLLAFDANQMTMWIGALLAAKHFTLLRAGLRR